MKGTWRHQLWSPACDDQLLLGTGPVWNVVNTHRNNCPLKTCSRKQMLIVPWLWVWLLSKLSSSLLRFCWAGTCDSLVKIITVFDVIYVSVWLSLENAVFMKVFTTSDFSQSFYPPLLFTLIIESWEAWLNINIQFRTEHPRVSYSLHMNPLHAAMLIVIYC